MDQITREVIRRFGLKINKVIPIRDIHLVETKEGYYCLKKLNYGIDKLLFIYGAKEHLIKNGYFNIDIYRTVNNKPYVQHRKDLYIMTKYIIGRECDFANPIEIHKASENLANFHLSSEGYIAPKGSKLKTHMGQWMKTYTKRCEDLIYIKNLIKMKSQKNLMDTLFLRNVDRYHQWGIEAVKMMQDYGYLEQVEVENKKGSFCHHDYTYHNIIIDEKGSQHLIDFDYCKHELLCYDIAHFIMRNMRRFYWDFHMAEELLESYSKVRAISNRELKLMFCLFQFPQRFWRISTRYYYEKYQSREEEFMENLIDTIDSKPFKLDFLEKYYKKYL